MSANVSTAPFHALAVDLKASGFVTQGERLASVLNGVWTTSSELISELGVVVITIRTECRPLDARQKALVKACLREVRKAWPGFGLFGFFPPR